MARRDAILSERVVGPTSGEICVFRAKSGDYAAEYKTGRFKWPVPVSGMDPVDVMEKAKRWLKTPMGER